MVKLFKLIRKTLNAPNKSNSAFIFPYSSDKMEKRKQVWENLQKGILLEDKQTFIHWGMPYVELEKFKESRKDRADRTEWQLGKRIILGGYESHVEVMRWLWKPTDMITKFDENLGYDKEGATKFNYLKQYITELLGEPTRAEIEKFGSLDIGEVRWDYGVVSICIIGIEHFNCRYSLHIGLIN